ncbi:MAG: class I SAM-dependent methyltransferase [Eggerthellaceae bacterium]|nr:class I SAM-dependent methyltransferase [Eggerthellaceae bacterium]
MAHIDTTQAGSRGIQVDSLAGSAVIVTADDGSLALSDGTLSIRGDFARLLSRIKPANLSRELVVKAARIKGAGSPLRVVDATAGLGEDSFLLAAAGFEVRLHENNPIIAALLADALERAARDERLASIVARMELHQVDSLVALHELPYQPDVVLLDPMFPERHKSASVKKKLQLLQQVEQPCTDEEALLEAAFAAQPRRIIVKRPAKGPYLAGRKPDYALSGKAIHFDCYAVQG